ncbi:tubulin glycylase 3A-like [Rhopalosiphum padi]|uniref:tubulin glycylase 3A-like n=1 Tax=Rhopalosiphum padi TaxID=40932 RepID=UPI00298E0987|nr:tubulin glycylase 3A-like [Rhopalosiphum padi]
MNPIHSTGGRKPVSVAGIAGDKTAKKIRVKAFKTSKNDPLPQARRFRWNVNTYTRLLRQSLKIECQSHIMKDIFRNNVGIHRATMKLAAPVLGEAALAALTKRASDAIQAKRIFSIHGYYPIISEELKKRGWIEKRNPVFRTMNYEYLLTILGSANNRAMCNVRSPPSLTSTKESLIIENKENSYLWPIVKDVNANYIFTSNGFDVDWNNFNDKTIFSQLNRYSFCSKIALADTVKTISKNDNVKFPRSYFITDTKSMDFFIRDFRLTALFGSIKIILSSKNSQNSIFSRNGTIPYEIIEFIEYRCWEFLNFCQTKVASDLMWSTMISEGGWTTFLVWYQKIVEENATIGVSNRYHIRDIYHRLNAWERKIKTFCPQFFIDGDTNLWIIKPTNCCSGVGIILERRLKNIMKTIKDNDIFIKSYVIQKYIERPLLISKVKVDLRQYFLVTNTIPIQIWMYKEGYVRFCSKKFTVHDLGGDIHLSNVRVQSMNRKCRTAGVPEECMWDFKQFKEYLKSIKNGDKWDTLIYPTMCETLTDVVMESFNPESRRGFGYQLFGADFSLTENFEPWLVEINNAPGLNPTTSIIARIATMLLRDIIKVTVDFPLNSNAETGLFENIYSGKLVKHCNTVKNITKEYYYRQ